MQHVARRSRDLSYSSCYKLSIFEVSWKWQIDNDCHRAPSLRQPLLVFLCRLGRPCPSFQPAGKRGHFAPLANHSNSQIEDSLLNWVVLGVL